MSEWRPCVGFDDYEVSDDGRVRSVDRVNARGHKLRGVELAQTPNTHGYRNVYLRRDGKTFTVQVHRLVLEAFVGPCPPGMETLHDDDDRAHNDRTNLRWGTPLENRREAVDRRRHPHGETHGQARLDVESVRRLRAALRAGTLDCDAEALALGCTASVVWKAAHGRTWKHVDEATA